MKNLFLSAAIVLGGLSLSASTFPVSNKIAKSISIEEEFTEIKITDLPTAILESLKKTHPKAVIVKAYKNEKSEYKLDITIDDKSSSVFATSDGTWITK